MKKMRKKMEKIVIIKKVRKLLWYLKKCINKSKEQFRNRFSNSITLEWESSNQKKMSLRLRVLQL